jgi:PAS domain S-box-containing protein
VKTFVSEIIQLNQLRDRVSKYYEAQQNVPSLLTQLDIMITLIDRNFKVWYLNEASQKFLKIYDLPREPCSMAFLGSKTTYSCRGCIVAETLKKGKNRERIYLHPFKGQGGKLKWIHSWTQPMPDENGIPILSENGKPIAVLESTQDLTDSVRLRTMPMKERFFHIARAIYEREDGFDRVRIYKKHAKETLKLIANVGYPGEIKPAVIDICQFQNIKKSVNHFRTNDEGCFHVKIGNPDPLDPKEKMEKFIHWPLMKDGNLLGLISVSEVKSGRPCNEDKIDIIRDYAEEALKAFEAKEEEPIDRKVEEKISILDKLLIQKRTPEDTLQTLVDEVCKLTDSDNVHIRYREENRAMLLPIGKGEYTKVAPLDLLLSDRIFPSVHAIITCLEDVKENAKDDHDVKEFVKALPEEAGKKLMDMGTYCVEPLIFQNRCIGSLSLLKNRKNHYDEQEIKIAREIAERMALAVRDYLVNIDRMRKNYAFDSSMDAIAFTDIKYRVNYVNKAFLKLWGYTDENEVIGKPVFNFWKDRKQAVRLLEISRSEESWTGETKALKKDGSTFDAQLSASLVKDSTDKRIGYMASFINITERKRLEKVQHSIYRISEEASYAQNLDALYPIIHNIVNDLIPADNFYIALCDEKTGIVSFPYFKDEKDLPPKPRKKKLGMTEYVIRNEESVLTLSQETFDELEKKGEIEIIGTKPFYFVGVPLKTKDKKIIGVLAVQIYEKGLAYTKEDKDMLVFVSTQIAMAIERKQEEQRKEVLLHEIHHRVKNNFNFIYSMLEMQSRQIEDQGVKNQFEFTKDRIMLMAGVHEKLYQSENLSEIDFTRYVKDLSDSLFKTYSHEEDKISLKLKIENVTFGIDKAIPFGMIINELVTNSLKYAFPLKYEKPNDSEDKILIELYPEDEDFMVLRVMDNGVGLPEDMDFFETPSLGVRLVRLLTKQIHGTIDLNRNCGTDVTIKFKV